MGRMLDLARLLSSREVGSRGIAGVREIEQEFIELLTFAPAEEIVSMLRTVLDEDWIGLPLWARNLAYRLACLQKPDDPSLLREAAADLLAASLEIGKNAFAMFGIVFF